MTLIFLCFIIVLVTFHSLYKGVQKIEIDEKAALKSLSKETNIEHAATLKHVGIDSIHSFPDYIPKSIIDEPDDEQADRLAYQYGIKNHKKMEKTAKAVNGLYVEMECVVEGKKKIINTLLQEDIAIDAFEVAKRIAKQKTHIIYENKETGRWFIIKVTPEQIEEKYKQKANKEILRGGLICIVSVIITLVFV